jgi:phosphoglycerate kinase
MLIIHTNKIQDGVTVTDDTRLRAIIPTTKFLLEQGANPILCSHFGRPKGEIIETGKNGRLTPVVAPLEALLGCSILKVNDCIGAQVEEAANKLTTGQVLLLENTRFHAGETKNDLVLAEGLSKLADYFVMDAFGASHRAHSSTAGVASFCKLNAAGYLMEKELDYLQGAVDDPKRPLMAIVGGAKVSTKIPVIESLLAKCDVVLIGGGMIFTFYKAMGYNIGASLVEEDMVELAGSLMEQAKSKGVKLLLPTDVVLADKFDNNANTAISPADDISGDWMGLDIGPDSIETFRKEIELASTIIWNGPMGVFEMSNFAAGTNQVAQMLADATAKRGAITIVGGGDSVAAIRMSGLADQVSHISTGGGASLELLEGKTLPGVAALTDV